MAGHKAFTAKTSTGVLNPTQTPLIHGIPSRWSIACDEGMENIAGFWTVEALALPQMARFLATSVLALISASTRGPKQKQESIVRNSHISVVLRSWEKWLGHWHTS